MYHTDLYSYTSQIGRVIQRQRYARHIAGLLNAEPGYKPLKTLRWRRQVRRQLGRQALGERIHAGRLRMQRVWHQHLVDTPGVLVVLEVLHARTKYDSLPGHFRLLWPFRAVCPAQAH